MRKEQIRKKADKLLQEYIRLKYKFCLVCGEPISCGHHFFPCSNSNATRYYLPNLIPICRDCHCRVHTQPHLVNPRICFLMGEEWYKDLIEVKCEGVKANAEWYQSNLKELERLIDEIKTKETMSRLSELSDKDNQPK